MHWRLPSNACFEVRRELPSFCRSSSWGAYIFPPMFLILRSKSQARDAMSFSVQVEGVPWHASVWDGKQVAPVVFWKVWTLLCRGCLWPVGGRHALQLQTLQSELAKNHQKNKLADTDKTSTYLGALAAPKSCLACFGRQLVQLQLCFCSLHFQGGESIV